MVDLGSKVTKAQYRAWYLEERAKREALEALVPLKGGVPLAQYVAEQRVKQLEAALRKYGQHTDECRVNNGMRRWCTCGLNTALGLPDHTPEAFASDAAVEPTQ